MIARMWHGRTHAHDARAYRAFLVARAIPDYRSVPGNLAVRILERVEGDVAHFVTLTYWESLDAIRAFAGDDIAQAKYYDEDAGFLLEQEPTVVHYEVVGAADAPAGPGSGRRVRPASAPIRKASQRPGGAGIR